MPLLALIAYGIGGLLAVAVHPEALGPGVGGYVADLLLVVAIPALMLTRACADERRLSVAKGLSTVRNCRADIILFPWWPGVHGVIERGPQMLCGVGPPWAPASAPLR